MLAEDLLRRLKSKALVWRVVKPITQGADLLIGDIQHDGFRWQIATNPFIGIFHRVFLPWRLRIAEPRSHALFQFAP